MAAARPSSRFLAEVDWATLVFFMGLFVMVGGLVDVGVIDHLGQGAIDVVGDNYWEFTKYGLVVTAVAVLYVWLRYFVL